MGTTIGHVAIFDSETVNLLNYFDWHKDKVRTLLVMPKQVEPCVCAEIPFPEQGSADSTRQSKRDALESTTHSKRSLNLDQPPRSFNRQFTYLENDQYITNSDPDSVLVTSVGNGKEGYCLHPQSKEEKVKVFDKAALRRSAHRGGGGRQVWEDVVLLTWKI